MVRRARAVHGGGAARRARPALVSLALLALAPACGPDGTAVPTLRSDHCPVAGCRDAGGGGVIDAGIPPEPLEDWDTTGAGPLTGIFAVETIVNATVFIPVETRQLFRLRIVERGRELHQKVTLCSFKLPTVEGVAELAIPPALDGVIESKTVETSGPFLSTASLFGAEYTPPASVILVGADLPDASATLPTAADPTGAADEDADGNPGVTVAAKVLTCEVMEDLYVALRTTAAMAGRVETLDRIAGAAQVSVDLSTLGYSDACLEAAARIRIVVEPDSPMQAVRVTDGDDLDGNGNVSCPELEAAAPRLFGDFWTQ